MLRQKIHWKRNKKCLSPHLSSNQSIPLYQYFFKNKKLSQIMTFCCLTLLFHGCLVALRRKKTKKKQPIKDKRVKPQSQQHNHLPQLLLWLIITLLWVKRGTRWVVSNAKRTVHINIHYCQWMPKKIQEGIKGEAEFCLKGHCSLFFGSDGQILVKSRGWHSCRGNSSSSCSLTAQGRGNQPGLLFGKFPLLSLWSGTENSLGGILGEKCEFRAAISRFCPRSPFSGCEIS